MKARSAAAKRKVRRGRPPKPDAVRAPSGQLSRSNEVRTTEERLMLEVATWKRRRENEALTIEEARKPEHGSVIDKWRAAHEKFKKGFPNQNNPDEFTQAHYDAALKFHELQAAFFGSIAAKRPRSASDFGGPPGHDNLDPFSEEIAKRHLDLKNKWADARRVILESGPLGMMAMEAIVINNQEIWRLLPDLRCACNNLTQLWKISSAA